VLVEPNLGVHVNAIELDEQLLVPPFVRGGESLLVPADTGAEIAAVVAARGRRVALELDAPVVRQVDVLPGRVIESTV